MDFAVSSGLQSGLVDRCAHDASAVGAEYEERKRSYLNTAEQCTTAGFDFEPFVIEAHAGGLGAAARRLLAFVASSAAATEAEEVDEQAMRLVGCLTTTLMRESARAILRRLAPPKEASRKACPAAWVEPTAGLQWQ